MKHFKFFITNEFPSTLQKVLMAYNIISKHANFIGLETTINAQINYCFSYNMIMVTKSSEIVKLCKGLQISCVYVKGSFDKEDMVKQILTYINESEQIFK